MKVDQPTNEVKGSGGTMPPGLRGHLSRMFTLSLQAEALANSLNAIIGASDLEDVRVEITIALAKIAAALSEGLDTPERFGVTA